jgi:protein TonB
MDGTAIAPLVLSPGNRRSLPLSIAAAALAHAVFFALLLALPRTSLPEEERVTYDVVVVAPPVARVASPEPEVVPESAPLPVPAVVAPSPPKPKPHPVAKAPALVPAPDDEPVSAGEPAVTEPSPSVAVAAPPVAPAPARVAADPAYARTLLTWLNRYRDYPLQARRRGVEGRVVLFLVVERSGRVSELKIATSSGAEILDEAALAMVRRADPMPPVPRSMTGDLIQFWIPVDFALSR